MWLYSSPLEAIVVVAITGTDRTVISYININSLLLLLWHCVSTSYCSSCIVYVAR